MTHLENKYLTDDPFKAAARRHQSEYRANVLQVAYDDHGSRLTEIDAQAYLNYYDGFNVIQVLRKRYPKFSKARDANMLRSEHIPFNLFAPLAQDGVLTLSIIEKAFGIKAFPPFQLDFEFAPSPKIAYLDDGTSFDMLIRFRNPDGSVIGIGIEVKYTEREYPIGKTEKANISDPQSRYWQVTEQSGAFHDHSRKKLPSDALRQIWRNHLLGLAMIQRNDLNDFYSITLYPAGNTHFEKVIPYYQSQLTEPSRDKVFGCTYEKYIQAIDGNNDVLRWKSYLKKRYIVQI
ncbi:MAG: hypothetical protein HGB26_01215 [Desulfobulbaceae bacterium]|nr:hypothetical protein [Desulfobulbaceae bacterium]